MHSALITHLGEIIIPKDVMVHITNNDIPAAIQALKENPSATEDINAYISDIHALLTTLYLVLDIQSSTTQVGEYSFDTQLDKDEQ